MNHRFIDHLNRSCDMRQAAVDNEENETMFFFLALFLRQDSITMHFYSQMFAFCHSYIEIRGLIHS